MGLNQPNNFQYPQEIYYQETPCGCKNPGNSSEDMSSMKSYIDELEKVLNKPTNASRTMNENQMRSYIAYLEDRVRGY